MKVAVNASPVPVYLDQELKSSMWSEKNDVFSEI
jgi:hypothetical protein